MREDKVIQKILKILTKANRFDFKYNDDLNFKTFTEKDNTLSGNRSIIDTERDFELRFKLSDIKEFLNGIYEKNQISDNDDFLVMPKNFIRSLFDISFEMFDFNEKTNIISCNLSNSIKNNQENKKKIALFNLDFIFNEYGRLKINKELSVFHNSNIKINYIIELILNMIIIKNYFEPYTSFKNNPNRNTYEQNIKIYNALKSKESYIKYEKEYKNFHSTTNQKKMKITKNY